MDEGAGVTRASLAAELPDADLYDADMPLWCDRQAGRLRHLAKTMTGDDLPDWPNLIEEVESLGSAQRHRVESLWVQAMVHLMKLQASPASADVPHWMMEIRGCLNDARRSYAPSMRQGISMDAIYADACYRLTGRRTIQASPLGFDDFLDGFPDVAALAAKLEAAHRA